MKKIIIGTCIILLCLCYFLWVKTKDYIFIGGVTLHQTTLPTAEEIYLKAYNWYVLGFYENGKWMTIEKATPVKSKELDEYIWIFDTVSKAPHLFTLGLKNRTLPEGNINTIHFNLDISMLNKPIRFTFNNKSYVLKFTGKRDYQKEEQLNDIPNDLKAVRDYKLAIIGPQSKQVLINNSMYIYNGFHDVWIIDIDKDELPDIITPIHNSPSVYDIALFLSSEAKENEMFHLAYHHEACGC